MMISWWRKAADNQSFEVAQADLSQVVRPGHLGVDEAYALGCDVLHNLLTSVEQVESLYADTKYRLYQTYAQMPKNMDPTRGPCNPATATFFNDTWLPAQPEYQRVKEVRSTMRNYIDALRMTYLPRLRVRSDLWTSGERHSTAGPSNSGVRQGYVTQ